MLEVIQIAIEVILPTLVIVGLAVIFSRQRNPDVRSLNDAVFYLFRPALVFDGLANMTFGVETLVQMVVLVVTLSTIMTLIGYGTSWAMRLDRRTESAFVLTVVLMNAANMGIPINEFAFGETGGDAALTYFVVTAMIFDSFGIFLASRGTVPVREAISNIFQAPLIYASVAGLAVNLLEVDMPTTLDRIVTLLSAAAIPMMLLLLGLQLARLEVKGNLRPLLVASGLRLVVAPVLALIIATVLGMEGVIRDVSIVESGMPAAVMTGILATRYDSDAPFATGVIMVSTLISLFTLSLMIALVD